MVLRVLHSILCIWEYYDYFCEYLCFSLTVSVFFVSLRFSHVSFCFFCLEHASLLVTFWDPGSISDSILFALSICVTKMDDGGMLVHGCAASFASRIAHKPHLTSKHPDHIPQCLLHPFPCWDMFCFVFALVFADVGPDLTPNLRPRLNTGPLDPFRPYKAFRTSHLS